MDVSPPPLQPLLSGAVDSPVNVDHSQREDPITGQSTACRADPTAQTYSGCAGPIKSHQTAAHKRKKKVKQINGSASSTVPSPSSSSSTCSPSLSQGGVRVACKRRNPRVFVGSVRRGERDAQAIALPLGMSIAAVIAQVLESKDTTGERMCVDHLSTICTSAVRESLANVFGDRFNCFVGNFEKSFQSTLKTLRMINESKQIRGRDHSYHLNIESCESDLDSSVFPSEGGPAETSGLSNLQSEEVILPAIETQDQLSTVEEIGESMQTDSVNLELALHQQRSQHAACVSLNALGSQGSVVNQSMLCTFEKSIMEQARSNDLKTYEIGLQMKKLQLKEAQLALNSDSNLLERFKLSMGISKASFKAEKLKNQLEETKHAELLRKCLDFLVAGLIIMCLTLAYGAYVHSYKRITEATAFCKHSEESIFFLLAFINTFSSVIFC
ncbi:protein CPR-5-like [Malania oleifera]|uniref:protein CPR-5-like n=1 Tax=Malania oleifera TaxID=397392 RepID=UPI0025ADEE42|nr:protein CPR-5-like [Malania oleifera]